MQRNVIVICVDTFRADMGAAGGALDFVRTPNVDRLRAQGVSFGRCFGEGEPTIPVRRCLFTGRRSFPWRHVVPNTGLRPSGLGWHAIPHEQTTLAERLSDVGYATGLVADTYHMFKPTMNYTRGFVNWDLIRGQETDPWKGGPADSVDLAAHTVEDDPSPADHAMLLQYLLNMRGRRREEDWLAPRVFRSAATWLEENRDNGPFFLWVDSFSPTSCGTRPTTSSTNIALPGGGKGLHPSHGVRFRCHSHQRCGGGADASPLLRLRDLRRSLDEIPAGQDRCPGPGGRDARPVLERPRHGGG